ncbi:MAG: VWA domain-containing protein [Acidobacteriota bacterium]|nr:VWA domain-containing protein [Acidobacteriota bacterium]
MGRTASPAPRRHAVLLACGVAGLLGTVLAPGSAGAQEAASAPRPELFTQAVDVRVVNVDVYATDRKGRPVTGLVRDDFLLEADGEPVPIAYFYSSAAGDAAPEEREIVEVGDDGSRAAARTDDPLVVLYLDNYWLLSSDRQRILDDLERFVAAQAESGVRFLVASHDPGLRIRTGVTRDPAIVLAALAAQADEPAQGASARRDHSGAYTAVHAIYQNYLGARTCPDPCTCGRHQMMGVWESYVANASHRIGVATAALQELLAALSGIPDRKAVLYVGSGFDQRPGLDLLQHLIELCPEFEREFATYMQRYDEGPALLELGAEANASRVTFYPLDAGGLRADGAATVDAADARLRPSAFVSRIRRANLEAGFEIMASSTGGRAILDANEPFAELLELGSDFRHVYALGFEPPGPPDGRSHRLRVALREPRPGVELRFRQSYVDKPLDRRLVERAIATMTLGDESNPLGVSARLGAITTLAPAVIQVPVEVDVDISSLELVPGADGARVGRFRVFLAARAAAGGRTTVREKFFDVTAAGLAAGVESIVVNINLEPGPYTIAVGVRDEIGTETSYLALETPGTADPAPPT